MRRIFTTHLLLVAVSYVLLAAGTSMAEVININFLSGSGPNTNVTMDTTPHTAAAAPDYYPGRTWNDFGFIGGAHNALLDSNGGTTTVNFAMTGRPAWSYEEGTLNPLDNYIYNLAGEVNTLSGLGANSIWDISIFSDDNNDTGGGSFTIGTDTLSSTGAANLGQWDLGVNYVKFPGVQASGTGDLGITFVSGTAAGMQLIRVPEPASVALLCVGLVGFMARRRR